MYITHKLKIFCRFQIARTVLVDRAVSEQLKLTPRPHSNRSGGLGNQTSQSRLDFVFFCFASYLKQLLILCLFLCEHYILVVVDLMISVVSFFFLLSNDYDY